MAQQPKFVFTLEEAAALGFTDLRELLSYAYNLVRTPISRAKFGLVARASSNRVFLGVNIEFPGLSLDHSISSEKFLFANLILNSEHCRLEFVIPDAYGPKSFKDEVYPLLVINMNNHLALLDPDLAGDICSDHPGHCSHLKCRALAAASKSYALYSNCPAGVALVDKARRVYQGWYMETTKYNLCLGPVQAALVDFVCRSEGKGFDEIIGAVLVEKKDATVRQEDTWKLLLKKIAAPNCVFNVFHCYVKPGDD